MPDAAPPPPPTATPPAEQDHTVAAFDPQTGAPVTVPAADFAGAFARGEVGLPAGSRVPVFKDGVLGSVPVEKAHLAFADPAVRVASQQDVAAAQQEKQYGGIQGGLIAGAEGALSGATMGLSDEAAALVGGDAARQHIENYRKQNPNSALAGQLVGGIAPMLLGDEAGAAGAVKAAGELAEGAEAARGASALSHAGDAVGAVGKVLGAPTRFVGRIGGAVERGVGTLLGETDGAGLVAGLAKRALAKGAAGAVEGAIYGAANHIDESALGDPEANGESLLASVGHGALLGGLAGGGLSAAGELGSAALGRAAPKFRSMAEEQAVRIIEPKGKAADIIRDIPGGVSASGSFLLDKVGVHAGDTLETLAPRIAEAKAAAGERIGSIYDAAEKAGIEGPSVRGLTDTVEAKVLKDMRSMPNLNRDAIGRVESAMQDVHSLAGIPSIEDAAAQGLDREAMLDGAKLSLRQAQAIKGRIGSKINWSPAPMSAADMQANNALKQVYGTIGDAIESAGEKAAREMGGSFAAEYREANKEYSIATKLDRVAQYSENAVLRRNIASPSTKAATMMGTVGALAHGATGPMGIATGLAAGAANHIMNTRGPAIAASVLDKLSALRGVQRAAQHMDTQIDRGVGAFFRDRGRAPVRLKPPIEAEAGEHVAETAARKVRAAAAAPEAHANAIERAAAPIAPHAPMVARAFKSAAIRGTTYLAEHAPKPAGAGVPSLTPQFDKPMLSDSQKADYARQVQAVHDPMSVLADMEAGRATRAQVDALKVVYPSLYQRVVERVQDRLADLKHPMDYSQKVQLSVLLGVPADQTMTPQFVQAMQANFASPPASPGAPPGKGKKSGPTHTTRPLKGEFAQDEALDAGQHNG